VRTKAKTITQAVRREVRERAESCCEACGLWVGETGGHVHHRQKRRFGDHSAANLVLLCAGPMSNQCHERAHADRDGEARAHGLVVRESENPATVEIYRWPAS
jgi:5-methylcytosine-specific restriction endonuclease McrA